jgi:uncharacterized protein (TIGR02145 family)
LYLVIPKSIIMRLFFSTLIFFCFATASAQCTYGNVEITVTGDTNKRIILTNTATGEAYQSYDTSSSYDQLPEALNSVSQWEPLSGGGLCTPATSISWVAYSIFEVYGSANCFNVNLFSLSGVHNVQPDGSVVLFNDNALTSFTDPESCNNNGNVEITVTGDTNKRIILTNTATGQAFQSYDTSSGYDQLPEALNWVGLWEALNGTMSTPNLDVTWDGYSILNTSQECMIQQMMPWECCDNSSDCFEAGLLSLGGEFSVQSDGSILLLTACDAPVGFCDCNGGVLDDCGVCGGDNSTCTDCAGVANGDALIQAYFFDADGDGFGYGEAVEYCSGSVPTCTDGDGDGVETGCWVLNNHDFYPDCYSNIVDCNGTCDGYEVENGCGECGGDQWALWYADIDGDGLGDPNTEISSCDYIEGYVIWNNSDPDDNCFSNVFDACGVCGGDNSTCTDCAGVASGEAVEDCAGVCGGTSVIDECGVCGGDNSTCADCCGVPNGDGTTCDGVCGACNDDTSCYGCTYAAATNYDSTATIDNGSCVYAVCDITSDNQAVYDGAYAAGVASVVCPDGGSSCPGDLDNDGAVATTDLLIFLSAYGGTCEVDEDLGFSVCGDDINHEGYDYSTVLIGDQCWFAENSRYLPEVSPSSASSETSPLYYVYGYEGTDVAAAMSTSNYETYGVLYNWPAVMTEGICPSGWHIPSDGEWQTMEISLGMSESEAADTGWRGTDEGYQMKSTSGWNSGGNSSNSSGFTGLPGGSRYSGGFNSNGNLGYWWSASESGSVSWNRLLIDSGGDVNRDTNSRGSGFSARCVRD